MRYRTDPGNDPQYFGGTPLNRRAPVSIGTILLIVLVLILLGVIPTWSHSRSWGYAPGGAIGLILIIVLVLLVMGRI